ncbi:hypothetical protein ACNY68_14245 [Pantoea sp. KXB25]|uniref:hypothetical protein n=1 Tax=unclassified Pantoea TaxID=2630326 RepID=UPI003AB65207
MAAIDPSPGLKRIMTPACCDNLSGFALPARLMACGAEKIVKKSLQIRTVMAGRRRSPLSEKKNC